MLSSSRVERQPSARIGGKLSTRAENVSGASRRNITSSNTQVCKCRKQLWNHEGSAWVDKHLLFLSADFRRNSTSTGRSCTPEVVRLRRRQTKNVSTKKPTATDDIRLANNTSSWPHRDGSPAELSGPTTPGGLLTSTVRRDDNGETTKAAASDAAVAMMMAAPGRPSRGGGAR